MSFLYEGGDLKPLESVLLDYSRDYKAFGEEAVWCEGCKFFLSYRKKKRLLGLGFLSSMEFRCLAGEKIKRLPSHSGTCKLHAKNEDLVN